MEVRVKKLHKDAVIPKYAKDGDAGMDLTAVAHEFDGMNDVYYIGLAFEIPKGYVGLIFPRSSNSKTDLVLTNSVAVIDSGYRGDIMCKFRDISTYIKPEDAPHFNKGQIYSVGDRVAQIIIIPYPEINFEEVEELSETERGTGGFGSTGK